MSPATPAACRRSSHSPPEPRARRSRLTSLRRARIVGVATLGAMTLASSSAVARVPVGGVSPEASASASLTLRPGARGPVVVALQKKLRIKADGAYGPRTKRAVRRFQRRRNMKADGIARPSVLTKLRIDARAAAKAPRVPPVLERIAQCESGGNPRAVSATGLYRGKYQFSMATWRRMGGEGDPAQAPEARQDRMAAKLFAAQGLAPWPHCGARA